uniref:Secreted protein n=1 Tax=Panagrellus redivivus TaxID=6233 RepID=A0A7E4W3U6_PANRE
MKPSFSLLLAFGFICSISSVNAAPTIAALETKVSGSIGKFLTKFTTQAQNIGYIQNLVNCTFYETDLSTCTSRLFSAVQSNLTSSQLTTAMGAGTKFLATSGGDLQSQISKMADAIIGVIQKPLITPIMKKKTGCKTPDAFGQKGLPILVKKFKKPLVCKAANACKKVFANDWTAAKNAFGSLIVVFTLCGL